MSRNKSFMRFASIFVVLGVLLAACAPAAPAPAGEPTTAPEEVGPKTGGTLTVGYWGKTTYSHFCTIKRATGGEEIWMRRIPGAKLVAYNEDYTEWVPDLAKSWEVSDDGLTLTFHLREGVKWHDGEPFTADDVVFTFALMAIPEAGNFQTFTPFLEGWVEMLADSEFEVTTDWEVPSVRAVDDHTVAFTLAAPFGVDTVFLGLAQAALPVPKHILGEYMESREKAATVCESDWALRNYVGLGPFKVVEYLPDERIVYDAYDDYHLGRPLVDRLVYTPFADGQTMVAAIEAGEIDLGYIPASEVERAREWDHIRIHTSQRPGTMFLFPNNREGRPGADVRVRQAMAYALDREAYAEVFTGGVAPDSNYPLEGYGGVPEDIKKYPYDPEKAKQLLAEAEADGAFDPERVIGFHMETIPADPANFEFIFDSFAKVGIKAGFDAVGQGNTVHYTTHEYDIGLSFLGGDPHPRGISGCCSCANQDVQLTGYCNPELDELWDKVDFITDPDEMAETWHEVQRILAEDLPFISVATVVDSWAINKRVQGRLEPSLVYWQGNHWQFEKLWLDDDWNK